MKAKKLLALILALVLSLSCMSIIAFATGEYYDFDSMTDGNVPTGWTTDGTTNASQNWKVYSYGGNKMLRFDSYTISANNAGCITTPAITLDAEKESVVSFKYSNNLGGSLQVLVSDNNSDFTLLKNVARTYKGTRSNPVEWVTESVDLGDYLGKTVYVRMKAVSNYGENDIFLDDFSIHTIEKYSISVGTFSNGSVSTEKAKYSENASVAVTVTPDEGYLLDSLTYSPESGEAIAIEKDESGYSFTMPAKAVTINATFVPYTFLDLEEGDTYLDTKTGIDQTYSTTINKNRTDVTKVQVSWKIHNISASVTINQIWNPKTLTWDDDTSKTNGVTADAVTAEFDFTNLSSIKIDAQVTFETASEDITAVATYKENAETEFDGDGIITLDTKATSDENDNTGKIYVNVPADTDYLKTFTENTTNEKYGIYTVTIGKHGNTTVDDVDGAIWFNNTASEAVPTDVLTIAFTKTAPAKTDYDSTWDAPANSKAYYNSTTKALTFVPNNGESFKMTDDKILKFGSTIIKGFEPTEADIITFAQLLLEDPTITTVDDIHAYDEIFDVDVYAAVEVQYCKSYPVSFANATAVTGLELWDVSDVTDFNLVFANSLFTDIDISAWDTAKATDMSYMFAGCNKLKNITLGEKWNTAKVETMSYMFSDCTALTTLPTEGWNTDSLKNMSYMFYRCKTATTIPVSSFNTSGVTDISSAFKYCEKVTALDVSGWDTSAVTDMGNMFEDCHELTSLSLTGFNTAKVTSMHSMFSSCQKLTELDISSFNTAEVTNMNYMFGGCINLEHIYVGSDWNIDKVTADINDISKDNTFNMFFYCSKLHNYQVTYEIVPLGRGYAIVDNGTNGGYLETK